MNEPNTQSAMIERKIDKETTTGLALGKGGSLDFANVSQIMEVAKLMAISQIAIPGHLRDNPGACLAVAIQASEWQMSPFAVANKSYSVNNRLAYEAQLVAAVILKRAPIVGRIKYHYQGEGGKRKCTTSATLADDGEVVEYTSPEFDKIPVKNSPLWKSDPDQQLGYYSVRAMCRRHFPDVLLGIYTPEEMASQMEQEPERQVGPSAPSKPKFLDKPAPTPATEVVEQPATPAPQPEPERQPEPEPEPAAPTYTEAERVALYEEVAGMRGNESLADFKKRLAELGFEIPTMFSKTPAETLLAIKAKLIELKGGA